MTEDERKMSLDYLRGQVEALQDTVLHLATMLPNIGLHSFAKHVDLVREIDQVSLDRNSAHRAWGMAGRSWNPMDAPPAVTLEAQGKRAVLDIVAESVEETLRFRESGDAEALIAATPAGYMKEQEIAMRALFEEGDTESP